MDANQEAIADAERETPAAECVLVQTTIGNKDDGMLLARAILDARLAAGVQVAGPAHSLYWYEGDFGDTEEWQVEIVTTLASLPLLETCIAENHPYFNPTIRILPIKGNSEYVGWISREVSADRADPAESGSAADA
jgi:periplasmic divalent cation tolerance protein